MPRRPPRERDNAPDAQDAFLAMTSMTQWVAAADTKLGLLAAALTVLTGAVLTQERQAWREVASDPTLPEIVAASFVGISMLALFVAVVYLVVGLRARVPRSAPNRFSFPHIAEQTVDELDELDLSTARRDAWTQARALAGIVKRKYAAFNRALTFAVVAGVCLAIWFAFPPA